MRVFVVAEIDSVGVFDRFGEEDFSPFLLINSKFFSTFSHLKEVFSPHFLSYFFCHDTKEVTRKSLAFQTGFVEGCIMWSTLKRGDPEKIPKYATKRYIIPHKVRDIL